MRQAGPQPARVIRIHRNRVTAQQWSVLGLLEPGFVMFKRDAFNKQVMDGMEREGMIERKRGPSWVLLRLTPEGQGLRDRIYQRSAQRLWRGRK